MKRSELQMIFACNVARLILHINDKGFSVTFGEAWRPPEMCAIYAHDGRGVKNSLHAIRLAVDLNLFKDGVYIADTLSWKQFGDFWESLNTLNRWGGRWGDGNHLEMKEA